MKCKHKWIYHGETSRSSLARGLKRFIIWRCDKCASIRIVELKYWGEE